jgi:hypothetical protein
MGAGNAEIPGKAKISIHMSRNTRPCGKADIVVDQKSSAVMMC